MRRSLNLFRSVIPVFDDRAISLFEEVVPLATMLSNEKKPGILIGLHGAARSGKDTVADWLKHKYGFKTLSYAGPLKEGISKLFDIPMDTLCDDKKKEAVDPRWGKSPREIMQWLGTDIFRKQVDEEFWVKHMGWRLEKLLVEQGECVVITDIRFDNEAELLKAYPHSEVWKIDASKRLAATGLGLQGRTKDHATEKGIKHELLDFVVDNNEGFHNLFQQVDDRLEHVSPFVVDK